MTPALPYIPSSTHTPATFLSMQLGFFSKPLSRLEVKSKDSLGDRGNWSFILFVAKEQQDLGKLLNFSEPQFSRMIITITTP